MADSAPIHLLKGDDEVLLADGVSDLVARLIEGKDRNEVLTEFVGDDYELGDVLLAASTVSMFGSRVVVARNAGRFVSGEVAAVITYLEDPAPDSTIVLVWQRGVASGSKLNTLPKKLVDAIKSAGGQVHNCGLPGGKGRDMWLAEQLSSSQVNLSPSATRLVKERLGNDLSRLGGILVVLEATFGDRLLESGDVEPYLGEAGSVPPWDLTDSIDSADVAGAVANLQRLIGNGARHPLQVMVSLQSHFERMLRLDGSGVRDEKAAAALLGMKGSTYPAKKALNQGRKLGPEKIARATALLAAADLDLRGRTSQDGQAVLEVLVARLAALSRSSGRR